MSSCGLVKLLYVSRSPLVLISLPAPWLAA